ncbi:hypothetical protein MMC28_005782 [Mycoblastus sanguinarius]|nr:hypothetical protein [Mycoblastus sanguinarius]
MTEVNELSEPPLSKAEVHFSVPTKTSTQFHMEPDVQKTAKSDGLSIGNNGNPEAEEEWEMIGDLDLEGWTKVTKDSEVRFFTVDV